MNRPLSASTTCVLKIDTKMIILMISPLTDTKMIQDIILMLLNNTYAAHYSLSLHYSPSFDVDFRLLTDLPNTFKADTRCISLAARGKTLFL